MKWFKHISDSLDDPFIFELMDNFGADGYLVFFGVLEIYSREFKPEPNWNLTITQAYLKQKLHKRQTTLIIKILKHIKNSGKWDIDINGGQIVIFIPKFTKIIDDWTGRKLRSKSERPPEKHKPIKKKEEDKEVRIKSKNNIQSKEFEIFWSHYPKKKSKGQALKTWNKLQKAKQLPDITKIMDSLKALKVSKDWIKSQGQFIPYPATWLNGHGWDDVPETSAPMVSDTLIHNANVGREWLNESG